MHTDTLTATEQARRTNAAQQAARRTGIAAEQLALLADHSERLACDYVAQGMSTTDAATQAADDTMALAAALGIR